MKAKKIKGSSFYLVNRKDYSHKVLQESNVDVKFKNGEAFYSYSEQEENTLIIRASTHRMAIYKAFVIWNKKQLLTK